MRKVSNLLLVFILLAVIIISGCSSANQGNFPQRGDFQDLSEEERQQMMEERQRNGFGGMPGAPGNMTEEERQQMFEERQQMMIDSCQGKNEGDSCQFESPMGDMEGTCMVMEENLVCTTNRPPGQR
jgi:hypothetical protein